MGGAETRGLPSPSAPTLAPAATGRTDLIRQLQQPAGARCPPGAPPTSGRPGVTAPGFRPLQAGGGGRPSPPPGPNYNPSHVPPNASKSWTQIL